MPLHLRSKNLLRLCAMSVFALVASAPWAGHVRAQTVTLDSNQPIALTTSTTQSAVSINAATGDVVVRSLAQNTQCTQAAGPVIDSFVANPSTTAPGTNIALTWQSRNTTQCTGSQGGGTLWSSLGQLPANNTNGQSIAIPANTPNNSVITFQLNCSTAGGPVVSQTTTVNVQVIDPGTCAPIYPNANNSSWVGTFGPWPAFSGRSRVSGIPANGYQSWSFVAGSVVGLFGSVATYGYPLDGDGVGQLSISRTPGCFTAASLGPNCLGPPNRFASIGWIQGPSTGGCVLTPGQTYYVNLTYGSGTTGPGPYCPGGSGGCGAEVVNQPQD